MAPIKETPKTLARLEPPATLTERVFERLRDAIEHRELPPGMHLSENRLASLLGASKTPVRESLLRLAHIGLAVPGPRGLHVVQSSREALIAAYEVRTALETEAAALAAVRSTPADVTLLMEAAQAAADIATSSSSHAWREATRHFHILVASAAKNEHLEGLVRDQYLLTWVLRLRDSPKATDTPRCPEAHLEIAEAIQRRAPEDARTATRQHFQDLIEIVSSAHTQEDSQSTPPEGQ